MKWGILSLLILAVTIQVSYADHLPDDLLAQGNPETKLAGIDLKSAKLSDVKIVYGEPTREKKVPNNPYWTGYVWEMPNGKIELGVSSPSNQVQDVYVEGTELNKIGRTGKGLKLGDDLKAIKRIYGNKFHIRKSEPTHEREEFIGVQDEVPESVTLQWSKEEFTLTAGLNEKGVIVSLWLLLPECYPAPCE